MVNAPETVPRALWGELGHAVRLSCGCLAVRLRQPCGCQTLKNKAFPFKTAKRVRGSPPEKQWPLFFSSLFFLEEF
jgi:hypothetical protein